MPGKKPTDLPPRLSGRVQPEDLQALVRLLRSWWDWSRSRLATASGVSATSLYNYETGRSTPPWSAIKKLARGTNIPPLIVEFFLLPAIVAQREGRGQKEGEALPGIFERLDLQLRGLCRSLASASVARRKEKRNGWPSAEVAREEAQDLWKRLQDCKDADRRHLVERWKEFQHPGLAELLCHESEDAASDRADRALALAKLAHRVAELVPEDGAKKKALVGYTLLFIANAVRVSGELQPARATFEEGLAGWKAGDASSTFLEEWRVLDREASLLRDERFSEETAAVGGRQFHASGSRLKAVGGRL